MQAPDRTAWVSAIWLTFMTDVASRVSTLVQLTTDGHRVYLNAVEDASGADVDYAMLTKVYGNDPTNETRYTPRRSSAAPRR